MGCPRSTMEKKPPKQWEVEEATPLQPYHFNRTQKASSKYCHKPVLSSNQCYVIAKQAVTVPSQPYFQAWWEFRPQKKYLPPPISPQTPSRSPPPSHPFSCKTLPPGLFNKSQPPPPRHSWRLGLPLPRPEQKKIKNIRNVHPIWAPLIYVHLAPVAQKVSKKSKTVNKLEK